MTTWRFENILPTIEQAIDARFKEALERITQPFPTEPRQAQVELGDNLDLMCDIHLVIDRRYGFGRPIKDVCDAIETSAQIGLRMQRLLLDVIRPNLGVLSEKEWDQRASKVLILHGIVGSLLLVANSRLLGETLSVVRELMRSAWLPNNHPYVSYLTVVLLLADQAQGAKLAEEWNTFREHKPVDRVDYNGIGHIIRNEAVDLNSLLQERLAQRHGSERTRRRHKNIAPSDRFSFELLEVIALALHNDIPLTFKDEAIPIYEFPIAQRSEIKALLPE